MHVNMLKSHRQRELSSALAIFPVSCACDSIRRGQLSGRDDYVEEEHHICFTCLFQASDAPQDFLFIYLFFSRAAETWRAGACMCIGLRGRFTWSCYSLISSFKFSLSPRICCHGGASATLALKACMASHASTTRMDRRLKRPVSEQKVKQLLLILRNVIMRRSKSASFLLMYEIKISYNTDRSISTETSDFNERSSGCH